MKGVLIFIGCCLLSLGVGYLTGNAAIPPCPDLWEARRAQVIEPQKVVSGNTEMTMVRVGLHGIICFIHKESVSCVVDPQCTPDRENRHGQR